jgi:hypothetical protein
MSMAETWAAYKAWKVRRKQTTFCYCKNCGNELCADPETKCYDAGDEVHYICGKCNWQIDFLFDAPVPIFLRAIAAQTPPRQGGIEK